MKKVVAEAPSNLAFVKYWGKLDSSINIPYNNSISVNLNDARTTTTVQFDEDLEVDEIKISNGVLTGSFASRVIKHLDRIRAIAQVKARARVSTNNTFPLGVGIASSASGFAALTLAASLALDLELSERELSILARLGSGSACRSIPGGFVEWLAGQDSDTSYAVSIAQPNYWNIAVISVVVSRTEKKHSSTDGHAISVTSPFFETRQRHMPSRLDRVRSAILEKDFIAFGKEIEMEAVSMHCIAMTAQNATEHGWVSGIYYWLPDTMDIIQAVQDWRSSGIRVFFTLDAGPTVHLICESENIPKVMEAVRDLERKVPHRSWEILLNFPAAGARVLKIEN